MKIWWIRDSFGGLFGANLTVALILYAQWVIVSVVLLPWQGFNYHTVLYTLCSMLALISHTRAQYCDPGAVPRFLTPERLPPNTHKVKVSDLLGLRACKTCQTLIVPGMRHCSQCQRCIMYFDHHCPWVNNCVGLMNQKYFLLFLLYTAICCIYSGALLVARFFSCSNYPQQCTISGLSTALCIANFIEALVFGLFVIIMMTDQISAMCSMADSDSGHGHSHGPDSKCHETSENDDLPKKTFIDLLSMTMGARFNPMWFLPVAQTKLLWDERERLMLQARAAAEADMATLKQRLRHVEDLARLNANMRSAGSTPGPAVPVLGSQSSQSSQSSRPSSTSPSETSSQSTPATKKVSALEDSDEGEPSVAGDSASSNSTSNGSSKLEAMLRIATKM